MSPALTQILQQAELRSRDDVLRLVKHFELLADRPKHFSVGHRFEEIQAFDMESLGEGN